MTRHSKDSASAPTALAALATCPQFSGGPKSGPRRWSTGFGALRGRTTEYRTPPVCRDKSYRLQAAERGIDSVGPASPGRAPWTVGPLEKGPGGVEPFRGDPGVQLLHPSAYALTRLFWAIELARALLHSRLPGGEGLRISPPRYIDGERGFLG